MFIKAGFGKFAVRSVNVSSFALERETQFLAMILVFWLMASSEEFEGCRAEFPEILPTADFPGEKDCRLDQLFQLLQGANFHNLLGWLGGNLDHVASRWVTAVSLFCRWASVNIDL